MLTLFQMELDMFKIYPSANLGIAYRKVNNQAPRQSGLELWVVWSF